MRQLKEHQDILRLTCGLMAHPEELIEQVCEFLSSHIHGNMLDEDREVDDRLLRCCYFIESLCKQLPQKEITDTSHCKAVSFLAANVSFVFIPNRIEECFVAFLQTPLEYNEIECAIVVNDADAFNEAVLDKVREKVERNVKIVITSLLVIRNCKGESESVHMERLINSVRLFKDPKIFVMQNCDFPPSVFSCITQQLERCNKMRFVCLNNVRHLTAVIAIALFKCNVKNLESFQLEQSELVEGGWEDFVSIVACCQSLKYLSFARTKVVIRHFLIPIVKLFDEVDFSNCSLSELEAKNVLRQSRQLRVLSLAGNSLTNCFDGTFNNLFTMSPVSLLQSMTLNETELSPKDFRVIGGSLREIHRQLRRLFISFNTLTNCVASLIPDDEPLANLEVLWMQRTSLTREDIRHLGRAVVSGSLPRLSSINLSNNDLFTMEGDLGNLVLACTAQYRTQRMTIYLKDNYLSEDFLSRIEAVCQGTNVVPTFEIPDVKLLSSQVQSTSLMRL